MDFLWQHYHLGYVHACCSRHPRRIYNGMAGWAFVAGSRDHLRRERIQAMARVVKNWHRG